MNENKVTNERKEHLFLAKLAEETGRYQEMAEHVKKLVLTCNEEEGLSADERNLFSLAYKQISSKKRSSWRILVAKQQREENKGNLHNAKLTKTYRKRLENELNGVCEEVLELLEEKIIPNCSNDECRVFFYKMKADYLRYEAEILHEKKRVRVAQRSLDFYSRATQIAESLPLTHPIRLGVALNFAVFYFEVMKNAEMACDIAKNTLEEVVSMLSSTPEEHYNESTSILQILRDNLTLWSNSFPEDYEDSDEEKEDDE